MPDSEPGLLERVFALKSIPELASLHADDLMALARVASPRPGHGDGATPRAGIPCVRFVVQGSLRPDAGGGTFREAPCSVGLVEALAGRRPPAVASDSPIRELRIARSALLEVMEEEFEVFRALLRCVSSEALRLGIARWAIPRQSVLRDVGNEPREIADRIALLRGVIPLRDAGIHLLGQIANEMETVERNVGDLMWELGEAPRDALLILDGTLLGWPAAGAPVRLEPGLFLGLAEALADERHTLRVEVVHRLRALRIHTEALVDALEDEPTTAQDLLCAIAREVVQHKAEGEAGDAS